MFNKKKKEKVLKESIKKEIIKELQKEKELEEEKNKIVEQKELPKIEHTSEDIDAIRKSFLKIFLFSVAVLFIIIVLIIINPFEKNDKKENNDQQVQEKEEVKDTLLTREDGLIENSNEELLELYFMMIPNTEEYYLYDSTYLYSNDELLVEEINKEYLLYLMTKSREFQNIINEKFGETKAELCIENGHIKIPIEDINELISSLFVLESINEYPDFYYTNYFNGSYSTTIKFVYSDGYYVSFCQEDNFDLKYNSVAMPIIKEAIKENGYIKINTKVAFSTSEKIYADYKLTNVISDDIGKDILEYINDASEYQYVFKEENNKYKLEKIIRVS